MTNKKTIVLGISILLFVTLIASGVCAKDYYALCREGGESFEWSKCNPITMTDYVCPSNKDLCTACAYVGTTGNYCPASGSPDPCNARGLSCNSYSGGGGDDGGTTIDAVPPVFSILSPLEGTISPSRKLFLNFSLDETSDVYYQDMNKNTNSWIKVCENCAPGSLSYAKLRTFAEGENNLKFKVVDNAGNPAYVDIHFTIDSVKPRIYRAYPMSNKFADGSFEVQFIEANPTRLTLHYGTDTAEVDLNHDCYAGMGKTICTIDVSLNEYNDEIMEYYFEIEDVAENTYKSRVTKVNVDTTFPAVNNPSDFYNIAGKYVNFNIDITEKNFYRVTFIDQNDPRQLTKTLCTRLVFGDCIRKQAFTRGDHLLSIQITDKAGQSTSLNVGPFNVTY
jgi:hypothetical protein